MAKMIAGLLTAMMILSSTMAFAETVYATKNGKRFHHAECTLVNKKSPAAISMEDAQSRGLTPCGKCFKKDDQTGNK
jgi:hypothetical protein